MSSPNLPIVSPTDLLPDSNTDDSLELSIILPARNEEDVLAACLGSLLGQSEPGFVLGQQWEILVIDDDSSDGTHRIAMETAGDQAGVTVMSAPALDLSPSGGFTGKSNACWAGAQRAKGRYLLFTDADTVHEAGGLSRALRELTTHHVSLLSYSPRQQVVGFWQHAVMPLIFSELASVYPPGQVSDPANDLAAANGQFLLVEREAYFAVGGHRVVGRSVLEDVALANNIKRSKRLIRFRYAPEALSARMYRTTSAMVEGWTKNLALLFPRPVALALWRILDLLLFFGLPVLAFHLWWLVPWQRGALMLIWARTLWRFYGRVSRANFPVADTALSILGVPLFAYMLIRSSVQHRFGGEVSWKGRSYGTGC